MRKFVLYFVLVAVFILAQCNCKKINVYCERFEMIRHQITIMDRKFFAKALPCPGEEAFCSFVRTTYTDSNKHEAPQFNTEYGINIYKNQVYMVVIRNRKRALECGAQQSNCDYLDIDLP